MGFLDTLSCISKAKAGGPPYITALHPARFASLSRKPLGAKATQATRSKGDAIRPILGRASCRGLVAVFWLPLRRAGGRRMGHRAAARAILALKGSQKARLGPFVADFVPWEGPGQ
jgi:hypothetical protein